VLYLTRREETAYLWFGLGSIAFGVNAIASSVWASLAHDRLDYLFRFSDASGHLTTAALMTFVWAILDRPMTRIERLYRDSHLLLAALVLVVPMWLVLGSSVPRLLWLGVLLFAASGLLISQARRGQPDARVLLLGAAAVVAAEVAEMLRVMGWPLPPNLPYVGFSVVLLSMAAALALRFSRVHRELDLLRRDLESQVHERTRSLEAMTRTAERANATKRDLLATLGHELREPLKSIVAFSHLLAERFRATTSVSGRERDFVTRIDHAGRFALRLTSDLLDLSRLETGRILLKIEPVDLVSLLEDVRDLMLQEAEKREVQLNVDSPVSVAVVHTDPTRLRQVLVNLVGNGMKFAPGGRVTLRVRPQGGTAFAVEVEDTGTGIRADVLGQVRTGRWVDGPDDARAAEGVGIGLRIARALCDALGLNLEFESPAGVGTTVRIVLTPNAAT